jgi:16S rRNA (cytosine967-C5)-methyltransferase
MRSHSYINSAKNILEQYKGEMPLAAWLKNYFAAHKKYGSKDRKQIAHLCYSFYRLGHAFESYPIEERLLVGVFLSSQTPVFVLKELKPEWNELIELTPYDKLAHLNSTSELDALFSWKDQLSAEINVSDFATSFLKQPLLFLRVRPGKKRTVLAQLGEAQIDYQLLGEECIAVENGTKLDEVLMIDKDVVVQDYSSQQVLTGLKKHIDASKSFTAWDCCAASGGKSILLKDAYPKVVLTASDVRESILHNLRSRLKQAGISQFNNYVADVSADQFKSSFPFDLVLCDAPCSGSGTWSRTPEQLYFFQEEKIDYYADLQKRIAMNAARALKKGGYFLYITCSVFSKENEAVVASLEKESGLTLLEARYYKGYHQKADTLFSALFQAL